MSALAEARAAAVLELGAPALLVVDVQHDFGDPAALAAMGLGDEVLAGVAAAVDRCAVLVDAARALGVPVYWIELATPADRPWRASQWLRGGDQDAPLSAEEPCVVGTPGAEWYRLRPDSGEPRTRKRGYSGFLGTGLAERLRADGVRWLTVIGLTTECCIHATATDALQLDWPVVVATDATAAYSAELHRSALELLALNVADLRSGDEIIALWRGNGATA